MHVSIALLARIDQIEKRLEAIERAQAVRRTPSATLAAQAERRHQDSLVLRSEIVSVLAANLGPERLTAKRICQLLARDPPPSIRTIQDHVREINAASSVPRF